MPLKSADKREHYEKLLMVALLGLCVALLLTVCGIALRTSRFEKELLDVIDAMLTGLGVIAETAVAWFIYLELRHSRTESVTRATEEIFSIWYGKELALARFAFLKEFVPNELPHLLRDERVTLKNMPDTPIAREVLVLVHFFDKVGWLGAAGMIDVDYVMGPMQHVMRKVWIAFEPQILPCQDYDKSDAFDPVFNYGCNGYMVALKILNIIRPKFFQLFLSGSVPIASETERIKRHLNAAEQKFKTRLRVAPSTCLMASRS